MSEKLFASIFLIGLASAAVVTGDKNAVVNSLLVAQSQVLFIFAAFLCLFLHQDVVKSILSNKFASVVTLGAFGIWLLSLVASFAGSSFSVFTIDTRLDRLLQTVLHVLSFACAFLVCRIYPNIGKALCVTIVLSLSTVAIYYWYLIILVDEPLYRSNKFWHYWTPFASNKRHSGLDMLVVSVLALSASVLVRSMWKRTVLSMFAVVTIGLVFWLAGRGTILALFAAVILLYLWLVFRANFSKLKLAARLLIPIALAVVMSEHFALFEWNGLSGAFSSRAEALAGDDVDLNRYSSGRLQMWSYTLEKIAEKPWLGHGPQAFDLFDDVYTAAHPHNGILQFLLEWGVFGTIPFVLLLLIAFLRGLESLKRADMARDWEVPASLAVVVALALQSNLSGVFYIGKPSFYFAICLAIGASYIARVKGNASTNPPPGNA